MQPPWLHPGCMAAFTIRIPDEMRDRIRQRAETDKRSVNGEIEWLLDAALGMMAINEMIGPLLGGGKPRP